MSNRERAKQVIREIVRVSGGKVEGKVRLYKTFYLAHLFYAKSAPDYLSDWPIVKMPNGPGIDDGDELLAELVSEGFLAKDEEAVGPYVRTDYRLLRQDLPEGMSEAAIVAIREAVELTKETTAAELSELTHEFSRSWAAAELGDELHVYVDLLTDEEYEASMKRMGKTAAAIRECWG